jgi:poly-gamma-glutamate synthesis protein (capsule biosynthesis protein)
LTIARPDVCALANNHVLDFGRTGLLDTLDALAGSGIRTAGAGRDLDAARRPAVVDLPHGRRVLVVAVAAGSSGVPAGWRAGPRAPGIDRVDRLSPAAADAVTERVRALRRPGDVVVVSVHWGPNWGYEVPEEQERFARRLVDGGVDVVHGHSSHHPKQIEIYRDRLILYGCGDFIDDYEGIAGYEEFRDDLRLMYLPVLDGSGRLLELRMAVLQAQRMRLVHAEVEDTRWVRDLLDELSAPHAGPVEVGPGGLLTMRPRQAAVRT